MINGLVLFTKTGGSTLALEKIVRPVAHHEPRKAHRKVLFGNGEEKNWMCVSDRLSDLLEISQVPELRRAGIDIIHGSLPTEEKYARSVKRELGEEPGNLYEQIYELAKEIQPKFLFFELKPSDLYKLGKCNEGFLAKLAGLGYDCRWDTLSAYDVGSPQKRERVYLLARKREEVIRNSTSADSRTGIMEHKGLDDIRTHSDFLERTPRRVAEVEAGLDEICAPQYREAFLRLSGLNSINQKN